MFFCTHYDNFVVFLIKKEYMNLKKKPFKKNFLPRKQVKALYGSVASASMNCVGSISTWASKNSHCQFVLWHIV